MDVDRLYSDQELVQFYDLENGWAQDLDYCRDLARGCASVLDLGCGTGLFAATLAQDSGCELVGVDPAAAMLEVAAKARIDAVAIADAIAARNAARKARDFKESDRIRDELLAKGIVLKDGPEGTTWEVKR